MAAFSYEDSLLFDVTHINKYVGVFLFQDKIMNFLWKY